MGLLDNIEGVLLVLGLARERKLVLGLAIGDLVDAEPLVRGADESRQVTLNILDIIQLVSEGVRDINDNDLPVSLAYGKEDGNVSKKGMPYGSNVLHNKIGLKALLTFVQKSHDSEDLDLLDLASVTDLLTNLADIQRIVVTTSLGLGVGLGRILPGLFSSYTHNQLQQ